MGQVVPAAVERYLADLNRSIDPILDDVARQGAEERLAIIDAEVGRLLQVLTIAVGARHVLEVGTAIGYSGIWLARALPSDGRLITMEADPASVARANFARAGLGDRAIVMIGDATRLLAKVAGPFDVIFQDGDKFAYEPMLDPLIRLLRPQGLLITDNVLWNGEVVPGFVRTPRRDPASTRAIAEYNRRLFADDRLLTSVIPLRDGVAVSVRIK